MSAIPLRRIEGKYEILEKLREGGMGAIYKVRHRLLDEVRVIKLMRQQLLEDEELKARFLREARLAIKLRHPNIAQLYDFTIDDDGTAFIVMEFIDGVTLEDLLALHGPPPVGFTLEIAQQALKALGYLHVRGFVHRDISPDNLMLTEDAEGQPLVKLIDLGLAKTLDAGGESRLTQAGTFFGKLRYAPPEQFGSGGTAAVGASGDQYSFGVVLYELLTGRFPIQGDDASSLIAGHLFRPPLDFAETDPGERVANDLRAVVCRILAKKPEDRFESVQALSHALAEFRVPSDLVPGDLRRLLSRPAVAAGSPALPGSTQSRLDQTFDLGPTPPPKSLVPLPTVVSAVPPPLGPVTVRPADSQEGDETLDLRQVRAVEDLLAKGDLEEAQKLLAKAAALYGETAFQGLQKRLEDLRRARRGEALAASAAEIGERLDRGELDEAGNLLDRAVVRFGAAGVLKEQWERLEGLRREAKSQASVELRRQKGAKRRAAELAMAAAAIEIRLDRGQFDEAAELLERAAKVHGEEAPLPTLRARLHRLRKKPRT